MDEKINKILLTSKAKIAYQKFLEFAEYARKDSDGVLIDLNTDDATVVFSAAQTTLQAHFERMCDALERAISVDNNERLLLANVKAVALAVERD